MSKLRLFIGLLVMSFIGLVWITPGEKLLRLGLERLGFEVFELSASSGYLGLNVAQMDVRSATETITLEQLSFSFQDAGWLVVDTLTLTQQGGASGVTTVGDLWTLMYEYLPYLPGGGLLRDVQLCQNGACESFVIYWTTVDNTVLAKVELPQQKLSLDVQLDEKLVAGWVVNREDFQSVGETVVQADKDMIGATVRLSVTAPALAEGVVVKVLHGELEAKAPARTPIDELLEYAVASGQINFDARWAQDTEQGEIESSGKHEVAIRYGDYELHGNLLKHPPVYISFSAVGGGNLRIEGDASCEFGLFDNSLECRAESVLGSFETDRFAADVTIRSADLAQNLSGQSAKAEIDFELFDLDAGLPLAEGTMSTNVLGNAIKVRSIQATLLGNELVYGLEADASGVNFDTRWQGQLENLTAYAATQVTSDLVSQLSGEVMLKSKGRFDFPSALSHTTELTVQEMHYGYDGYELSGTEIGAEFGGWPIINGNVTVATESISAGVVIENLETQFSLLLDADQQSLKLNSRQLQFGILGGLAEAETLQYDYPSQQGQVLLAIKGIQLPQVLALQRQDFQCAGTLDGSVPVQISGDTITISNAAIEARAPGGFIRYRPDSSVTELGNQNQGLEVVLAAMNNFQYHVLSAEVDYSAQGQMIARTKIKGANPDYQDGREVHLNLTVEENVQALLQSLRLGGEVAEKIGAREGARYE